MCYREVTVAYCLIGEQFDECLKLPNSFRGLRFFEIRKPQILMSDSVFDDFNTTALLRDSSPHESEAYQQNDAPQDASSCAL